MQVGAIIFWVAAAVLTVFALVGDYIAEQKGRRRGEGIFFGLLLGPFGWLLEACLPTLEIPPRQSEPAPQDP
jgi:hypothetical protein